MATEINITNKVKELAEQYSPEMKYYIEQWYKDWHKIDPDQSEYINFHQYCEIRDVIALLAAATLQESNDSLNNHSLSTLILQGPEYTGSRFIKWLKKKLGIPVRHERLRIIIDDKCGTDIDMDFILKIICRPIEYQLRGVLYNHMQRLIKKLKETK